MNYSIADFLITIKNSYMAKKKETTYPFTKMVYRLAKILEEEKYIKGVKEEKTGKKALKIELLYKNKNSALRNIKIISKPSVHVYVDKKRVPRTRGGFGITILSTSKGVMTDKKAKKENVGGEVICQIY